MSGEVLQAGDDTADDLADLVVGVRGVHDGGGCDVSWLDVRDLKFERCCGATWAGVRAHLTGEAEDEVHVNAVAESSEELDLWWGDVLGKEHNDRIADPLDAVDRRPEQVGLVVGVAEVGLQLLVDAEGLGDGRRGGAAEPIRGDVVEGPELAVRLGERAHRSGVLGDRREPAGFLFKGHTDCVSQRRTGQRVAAPREQLLGGEVLSEAPHGEDLDCCDAGSVGGVATRQGTTCGYPDSLRRNDDAHQS